MTGFRTSVPSNPPVGIIGKALASVFFLVFLGMGSVFVWLVARDALVGLRLWTWQRTPCEILASAVRETGEEGRRVGSFYLEVKYRYNFASKTFTCEQYKRSRKAFSDYGQVARLTRSYPPGSTSVCFVNPSAPGEAVLARDNPVSFLLALFPMIFVVIGAGGLYFTWRPKSVVAEIEQPISERSVPKGLWLAFAFFAIFFLVGGGLLYGFFLRPVYKILEAKAWSAVPCVVISSEVQTHSGDDGPTYSVNILYSYAVNGTEFKANRYNFMGGSSSGYAGKQAVVSRHPPGTKTVCYVNPSDPTEAVLDRGLAAEMWFGAIPLLFVLVGMGGWIFLLRKRRETSLLPAAKGGYIAFGNSLANGGSGVSAERHHQAGARLWDQAREETLPDENAPVVLKPKMGPWVKLLGITLIALFWNGIVSVFVGHAIQGWRSGRPDWFLSLFMVPFVLVGLGFLAGIVYCFLALFNPRPQLKVIPGAVTLGGALRVEWEMSGRTEVLRSLRVCLQGREEATYRRGTSTCTDTSLFADLKIAEVTALPEMRSGRGSVVIPADLMHSFSARNNRVMWVVRLHGEIPRWPDLNEEFPVTVLPRANHS